MRNLLMPLLLVPLGTTAQEWCVPGAAWVYRYTYLTDIDFRSEYRHIGDTLIDGVDAHVLQGHSYGTTGSQIIHQQWRAYERVQDGVIYSGSASGGWDTLYWFGQVGDRWWPIGHPQNCPPEGMLEILATGTTTVQGIPLATITVAPVDQDGVPMFDHFAITERIGSTPRHPFIWDCIGIIDYFFVESICYSDSEIQLPPGQACTLTLDSGELPEPSDPAITVRPNPGASLRLSGLGPSRARLRILNASGAELLPARMVKEHEEVDASALAAGLCIVEVTTASGRQFLRWVKE